MPLIRGCLDGALPSAESLLAIINSILDVSKIEAGKMELEQVDFELSESLSNAIKTFAMRAHHKHLELTFEVRPNVPNALIEKELFAAIAIATANPIQEFPC